MSKKQTQAFMRRIAAEQEALSVSRDKLREIMAEAEALLESNEDAHNALDEAIDALSRYA